MSFVEDALKFHAEHNGMLAVASKVPLNNREDLALAYTPGVAEPCKAIKENKELSFEYTCRGNTVAIVSDGTRVLGLGDIGPEAAMPVMEGKAVLFKTFGDVDAIPICIDTKDPEEIIETVRRLQPTFAGINLEDFSSPKCYEIEDRLREICDIPVFHDDQHGTAIVMTAALRNALKLAGKRADEIKVVINGPGAAGIAIAKFLLAYGVKDIIMCGRTGMLCEGDEGLNSAKQEIVKLTNLSRRHGSLADALKGADVFIGVSVANCVTKEMVASMADKAILFTCANPVPEINPVDAKEAGAFIVGTGSSEYNNQINNVLVFPGVFRGALDVRANTVNTEMMIAAANAIADFVPADKLSREYILPEAWNKAAHEVVAKAVAEAAVKSGVSKLNK